MLVPLRYHPWMVQAVLDSEDIRRFVGVYLQGFDVLFVINVEIVYITSILVCLRCCTFRAIRLPLKTFFIRPTAV